MFWSVLLFYRVGMLPFFVHTVPTFGNGIVRTVDNVWIINVFFYWEISVVSPILIRQHNHLVNIILNNMATI